MELVAAGVIPRGATLDEARVSYIRHLRAKKGGVTDERTRFDAARAEKTELEVAQLRGELVRRDDVVETWSTRIVACKAQIRGIPKRLALAVPGFTRHMAAAALDLIDEVLNELAGDVAPVAKRRGRVGKRKARVAASGEGSA